MDGYAYNHNPDNSLPVSANGIMDIMNRLLDAESLGLNGSHVIKQELHYNRFRPALFEVLCEMKQRFVLGSSNREEDDLPDPQTLRLDNMLLAEGIAGPETVGEVVTSAGISGLLEGSVSGSELDQINSEEHSEYRKKLSVIRTKYLENLRKFEKDSGEFIGHILTLLQDQALARPISHHEIEKIIQIIRKKMSQVQQKIKQDTCEMVMLLRSRFLDARRKRRNFSKTATKVLNEYFYANLANPYPSEEIKEELARKCSISVSQVSNWFGNKRIRFKKNIGKGNDSRKDAIKQE